MVVDKLPREEGKGNGNHVAGAKLIKPPAKLGRISSLWTEVAKGGLRGRVKGKK